MAPATRTRGQIVLGSVFAPEVLFKLMDRNDRSRPLMVVSVGENEPAKWGTSAGLFYKTVTTRRVRSDYNHVHNRDVIKKAWRDMNDEVAGRGFSGVQKYYANDRIVVPIFRVVELLLEDHPESAGRPVVLMHAPDFRIMNEQRAMRILVDCYRVVAAAAAVASVPLHMPPLSAGVFAKDRQTKQRILGACKRELLHPAPVIATGGVSAYVYCFTAEERKMLMEA